uniref:Uncharacterized protein n=1 Tax=Syphacia muris TaxID=451379 RepID=A0A0N5AZY1_9BILA
MLILSNNNCNEDCGYVNCFNDCHSKTFSSLGFNLNDHELRRCCSSYPSFFMEKNLMDVFNLDNLCESRGCWKSRAAQPVRNTAWKTAEVIQTARRLRVIANEFDRQFMANSTAAYNFHNFNWLWKLLRLGVAFIRGYFLR